MPPAVVAALTEELGLLSDGARLVLEGAAVAGDPFEPELVAAAAAVTEPAAFAALDELLRCDLVRPTDVPRRFRFRHPLVRRAVYDASPGGWRLGAHERCAQALAARGASVTARVHHVERSARHGDEAAVARPAGGRNGGGTAHAGDRGALVRRGLARCSAKAGRGPSECELLTALAGAQAATGQFADARAALLEALQLLPEDEHGDAPAADCGMRGHGAVARPPRGGARPPRRRARRTRRPRLARGGGADDHARDGRLLPPGAQADSRDWGERALEWRGRSATSR